MNAVLTWLLVGLGILVLVVPRVDVGIGLLTLQSLTLIGLLHESPVASAMVAVRSIGLALFLYLLLSRAAGSQPIRDYGMGLWRYIVAGIVLSFLIPDGVQSSDSGLWPAFVIVCTGLLVATRHVTLFQLLGLVMVGNGIVLATSLLRPPSSWFEIAATADLLLVAGVAGFFHRLILTLHGSADTRALRSLHD